MGVQASCRTIFDATARMRLDGSDGQHIAAIALAASDCMEAEGWDNTSDAVRELGDAFSEYDEEA